MWREVIDKLICMLILKRIRYELWGPQRYLENVILLDNLVNKYGNNVLVEILLWRDGSVKINLIHREGEIEHGLVDLTTGYSSRHYKNLEKLYNETVDFLEERFTLKETL